MSTDTEPLDVLVAGGGPSGSAAARLLASWGHRVLVVGGRDRGAPPLAESLPPSTRKLFDLLGVSDRVAAAGFVETRGNTSWWAGAGLRALPFADGSTGFQVERGRLDALLLEAAAGAGARVLAGATVERVELGAGDLPVTAEVRDASGALRTLRARRVLDCSGRAGVLAREGFRDRSEPFTTVALAGMWERPAGWSLDDPTHTVVESYDRGWVWSVPVSATRRCVAAMVDPSTARVAGAPDLRTRYTRELRRAEHVSRLLEGARPVSGPWAYGATPYGARRFAGDAFLLVGDAGSFLDPLSSYGVKKALSSGWLAAVATHTGLADAAMAGAAVELFEEREREAWTRFRALTARFHAQGRDAHGGHFWEARAGGAPDAGSAAGGAPPHAADLMDTLNPDPSALLGEPAVRAAFEALRASPGVRLEAAPTLRRVRRPTVQGRRVVLEERLASPAVPAGLATVRGVDLPLLVSLTPEHGDPGGLFEAYAAVRGAVPLPDFLFALSVLLAADMLVNAAVR